MNCKDGQAWECWSNWIDVQKIAGGAKAVTENSDMVFLIICLLIFLGSLATGCVPLLLSVSKKWMNLLSAFGAGLLVSTALAIILPEGMEAYEHASSATGGSHGVLGAAIVGGFVLMLLVDHLQGGADHLPMSHHDTDDEEALRSVANASTAYSSHTRLQEKQKVGSRALIGLLVHSLADGVAVGSTGVSDKAELKIVVAFAMILHKLPATFGLVSFLISCKWTRSGVLKGLLVFAASAPLMALATYWVLVAVPVLSSETAVALWLATSGGTFLYASCMHVLPHALSSNERGTGWADIVAIVLGCATPVMIQVFNTHSHSTHQQAHDTIVRSLA